jgi:hypothetical protein
MVNCRGSVYAGRASARYKKSASRLKEADSTNSFEVLLISVKEEPDPAPNDHLVPLHEKRTTPICDFSRAAIIKLMKRLLPLMFAVVLSAACLVPPPASAYYYHGRYYRYRYGGHYYRYHHGGHYYLHRRWVTPAYGRPGYYRYW